MRRPPILFLDEPVSAQDPNCVEHIFESLETLSYRDKAGREEPVTLLCITHNITAIKAFTHILYIVDGTVVEHGSRESLMARRGHFYRRQRRSLSLRWQ